MDCTIPPVNGTMGSVVWKKLWKANPVTSNVEISTASENVRVIVSFTKLNSVKASRKGCIISTV